MFGSGDEAIVVAENNEVHSVGKQKYMRIMYNVKCTLKISKPTPTCAHVNLVKIHTNCHETVMKDICNFIHSTTATDIVVQNVNYIFCIMFLMCKLIRKVHAYMTYCILP